MRWRYRQGSTLEDLIRDLLRIYRQLLLVLDGDAEEALDQLDRIAQHYGLWRDGIDRERFEQLLEATREVRRDANGTMQLSTRGEQALRKQAFDDIFRGMRARAPGGHRTPHLGGAGEAGDETRPFVFGDAPDSLDASRTLGNWIRRTGGRTPITESDLEVRERERSTGCATVLLIDVSHSMTLYGEDRITPAKRVALALAELITTRYPKDSLDVVLFGDEAQVVPLERLPYITNGPFHTNTRAGLIRAQELLRRRKTENRQIVMITDGKPSAIHEEGQLYKNPFGLDPHIVAKTLEEGVRCRRKQIGITTFMLTSDPHLRQFIERFTEVSRGRAWFSESSGLESFVLVDFVRNRRRNVR